MREEYSDEIEEVIKTNEAFKDANLSIQEKEAMKEIGIKLMKEYARNNNIELINAVKDFNVILQESEIEISEQRKEVLNNLVYIDLSGIIIDQVKNETTKDLLTALLDILKNPTKAYYMLPFLQEKEKELREESENNEATKTLTVIIEDHLKTEEQKVDFFGKYYKDFKDTLPKEGKIERKSLLKGDEYELTDLRFKGDASFKIFG